MLSSPMAGILYRPLLPGITVMARNAITRPSRAPLSKGRWVGGMLPTKSRIQSKGMKKSHGSGLAKDRMA